MHYDSLGSRFDPVSCVLKIMQAHVGSRGGSALLEHFEDLANAGKRDALTLKSAMNSEVNYVQDKAMDPSGANYRKPSSVSGPPPGATHLFSFLS